MFKKLCFSILCVVSLYGAKPASYMDDAYYEPKETRYLDATLVLSVNDVDENITQLKDSSFKVFENLLQDDLLGFIGVDYRDCEIDDIVLSSDDAKNFNVDKYGKITLKHNLDFEKKKVYNFNAQAICSLGKSNNVNIKIEVLDIPDIVSKLSDLNISIKENTKVGSVLGKVNIVDDGDSVVNNYEIVNNNRYFSITNKGEILLNSKLDYETLKHFSFDVVAISDAGVSKAAQININIEDVADELPTLKSANFKISEDTKIDTVIGKIELNKADSNISKILISGDGSDTFHIDNDGALSLKSTLDYEKKPFYNLWIQAFNLSGKSDKKLLKIEVLDKADVKAKIDVKKQVSILQNAPNGSSVTRVNIVSMGDTKVDRYRLLGDDAVYFTIDNNGLITVDDKLDKQKTVYKLEIQAKNKAGYSKKVPLKVKIIKLYDDAYTTQNSSIDENDIDDIANIEIDLDHYKAVSYSISGKSNEIFSVDKDGELKNKKEFDYENNNSYIVDVSVKMEPKLSTYFFGARLSYSSHNIDPLTENQNDIFSKVSTQNMLFDFNIIGGLTSTNWLYLTLGIAANFEDFSGDNLNIIPPQAQPVPNIGVGVTLFDIANIYLDVEAKYYLNFGMFNDGIGDNQYFMYSEKNYAASTSIGYSFSDFSLGVALEYASVTYQGWEGSNSGNHGQKALDELPTFRPGLNFYGTYWFKH